MLINKIQQRENWVDVMKGICMMFVIISHSFPPSQIIRIYTPFFLTGFFFCSGYTFNSKNSFHEFVIGKIKTFLVPLVTLSLVNGIVGVIFKGVPFTDRLLGIVIQRANGYESLWYIACLFTSELMFYTIFRLSRKWVEGIIACHFVSVIGFFYIRFVGVALPWQLELACIAQMFLAWGLYYRKIELSVDNWITDKKYILFLMTLCYIFLCLIIDNDVNYHEERFANEVLFVAEALISIFIVIRVAKRISNNKFFLYIGRHSIIYFAFQGFLIVTIRKILVIINISDALILSLLSSAFAVPILSIAAHVIFTYFPFFIGKSWKESKFIR